MEIKGLNSQRTDALNRLADQLLKNDDDKQIQISELKKFIEQNEAEFISLQIDPETAAEELKNILGSSYNDASEAEEIAGKSVDETGTPDIEALKKQIIEYRKELSEVYDEKVALEERKSELEELIREKNEEFKDLEETISERNEEHKKIIDEINKATADMKEDVANKHKRAVYEAMSKYNPEEDGEWSDYISKYLNGKDFDSSFKSKIQGLTSKSEFVANDLSCLGSEFSSLGLELESLNCELEDTTCQISTLDEKMCSITGVLADCINELANAIKTSGCSGQDIYGAEEPDLSWLSSYLYGTDGPGNNGTQPHPTEVENKDDIMNLIPESERLLAQELGIDLTEKLEDGTPRYIFAKGTAVDEGDVYHMYDMGQNTPTGDNSLVRLEHGYGDDSFNEIPQGNGGITPGSFSYCDEPCEGCQTVYYMDDCDHMQEAPATYDTKSPLSFDLNNDGVKTSSKVIDYDIDGDGEIDKINDSADAVLVFNKNMGEDDVSGADGSETFGDNTDLDGDGVADGYKNGFEALRALAEKEGLVNDEGDDELDANDLKILEEKHGLKIKANGYNSDAQSLSDVGITSIKLSNNETELQENFDGNGNHLMTQKGATFTVNGEEREYADIWHKKLNEEETSDNFFMDNDSIGSKTDSVLNEINEVNTLLDEALASAKLQQNEAMQTGRNIFTNLIKNVPENKIKKQDKPKQ